MQHLTGICCHFSSLQLHGPFLKLRPAQSKQNVKIKSLTKEPVQQPNHHNYTALTKELFSVNTASVHHLDRKGISSG